LKSLLLQAFKQNEALTCCRNSGDGYICWLIARWRAIRCHSVVLIFKKPKIQSRVAYTFILQLALCQHVFAENPTDNWSINEKLELPPEQSENRIIKWCDNETGKNIRFSSANIEIKGYHPCGAIVSTDTCDENNNKILGNPKSGIFKSCEKNQNNYQDNSEGQSSNGQKSYTGLNHSELKELKFAMKKAAEKQNSSPEVQLQILADQLLANFFDNSDKNNQNLSKLLNTTDPQKMMDSMISKLEKSLPLLDQDTRKLVEPLLKNLKKGKY
jgi:hypothetical protein